MARSSGSAFSPVGVEGERDEEREGADHVRPVETLGWTGQGSIIDQTE